MQATKRRRPSATRVIGLTLVALAYAAVLIWASDLTGADAVAATAGVGTQAVEAAQVAQAATVDAAQAATVNAAPERPLVTLVIAGVMAVMAVLAWVLSHARRRRPLARSARLVVRHITTLL
jgi:sensor c-di-GMP phosphodiesterase-like protein